MLVCITHLKAPWPPDSKPGDVVDLGVDAVPAWAVGKCTPVPSPAPDAAENVAASAALAAADQQHAEEVDTAKKRGKR